MHYRRRALTLIELLVVIGIIAVLLGILVPTVSRARASATDVQCKTRLRQLHQAMQVYALSNRDRMTPIVYPGLPSPYANGATSWRAALAETLRLSDDRAGDVFECPTRPEDTVNTFGLNTAIMMPQWSLRLSKRPDTARGQFDSASGTKAAQQPFSELILFADKGASTDAMLRSSDGYTYLSESTPYGVFDVWEQWVRHSPLGTLRHRSRANAVFMDGHVASVRDELRLQSGHWYFGDEPPAIKTIGAGCCR